MTEQFTERQLKEHEFSQALENAIAAAAAFDFTEPENWKRFCALVALRTPEQVARMEQERGIDA